MPAAQATDLLALLDQGIRHDPYPLYARLRAQAPFRLEPAPVVVLASHEDCTAMLRHPQVSVDRTRATLLVGRAALKNLMPAGAPSSLDQPSFLFRFCLGAPLARMEARLALTRLAQRVSAPRLVADPPPYKPNATLRGPSAMPLEFDEIQPKSHRIPAY